MMDMQKEIDILKVKSGYDGKPQQWQYGFDLACRELAKAKVESHKQAALYQSEINHLAQANQQWREKAAKAQAVPEGFVLVPKEPTQELLNKMQDFFVGAFENGLTGGQSIHCAYIAMIEAQEQANESE